MSSTTALIKITICARTFTRSLLADDSLFIMTRFFQEDDNLFIYALFPNSPLHLVYDFARFRCQRRDVLSEQVKLWRKWLVFSSQEGDPF